MFEFIFARLSNAIPIQLLIIVQLEFIFSILRKGDTSITLTNLSNWGQH